MVVKPDEQGWYQFYRVLVVTDRPGRVQEAIARDNATGDLPANHHDN
jgi:hypothetical protein